jgi:hypothetical protein
MHWVKAYDFRAWVVLPEMGQTKEVGAGRHVGQNITAAPLIGKSSSTHRPSCAQSISAGSRLIVNWPHETAGAFHFTAAGLWNISLSPTGLEVRGMECDRHSGPSVWRAHIGRSFIDHRATDRVQLLCPPAWRGRLNRRRSALHGFTDFMASEIVTRYTGAQMPCEEGVKKSTAVILIPQSREKDLRSWFGFK